MYEVELKVRADHEAVRERIENTETIEIGYRGTIAQEDTYYDAPHREFAETDEALRVRRETTVETGLGGGESNEGCESSEGAESAGEVETAVLTYKGPLVDNESKTRREAETEVGDAEAVDEILSGLGFSPAAIVRKERSVYSASDDGPTVVLDRVENLGEFVEVELEAEENGIDAARERVRETLCDLGLDPDDQVRTAYLGLLSDENEFSDDQSPSDARE